MTHSNHTNKDYETTLNGSINYEYYQQRAHKIRSESIFQTLKEFFSSKKNSRIDNIKTHEAFQINNTKETNEYLNFLSEAA